MEESIFISVLKSTMDWCIVNWRTGKGETYDVFEHECQYNKPRWSIAWSQWVPIAFGIVNALLK